jgi:photosystem II stability/assembly factor-like uncharacterized protein
MSAYYLGPNQDPNGVYGGEFYAIDTSGGFSMDQSLRKIPIGQDGPITQFDVTDALQIVFDVATFNERVGIIKDASNTETISADLNERGELLVDSVTISTGDFIEGININSIVSMGRLSTLYSDFNNTVKTYFGLPNGFASLFAAAATYNVNGGIFNATTFINLINGNTFDPSGSYISDLSGYFTVNSVNNVLSYACSTNVLGNRPDGLYHISDGFLDGDLLFIPKGMTINLSVNIDAELPGADPINIGPLNLLAQDASYNYADISNNVYKRTSSTVTNISQSYEVPMLIILKNTIAQNTTVFGDDWTVIYAVNKNWLAIAMSSSGEYQTAIEEDGRIYVSNDYGVTWTVEYNIGVASSNCVSISQTGQYQTASNGTNIFISIDFGQSWSKVFNMGTSNIFLCISLTGQYQTLVSCGDTVYRSTNYGITWSALSDINLDIYNSIAGFPTAGLAMSYNGQYQTIVSENIYLSSDYGRTWTDSSTPNGLDDRNWEGIAMSSTGRYQTAIESGGEIYISADFGNTWRFINTPIVTDKQWQAVEMTSTGQYQVVIEKQGTVYISVDYGASWRESKSTLVKSRNWQALTLSANGLYISAVEYGGYIYGASLTYL